LVNEWKPEWNIKAEAAGTLFVMRSDSLTTAWKVRQPIEAPGDIANVFDGITYGKGQAVIGMFENYIGSKEFQRAIKLYLLQHAWGNATSADLLAALDTVSGSGAGTAFSTFLNQVGFPVVSVKVSCPEKAKDGAASLVPRLELEQRRFLPVGSPGATDAVWSVPVCVTWGVTEGGGRGTHRQCVLLAKAADQFDLDGGKGCPAWLFADSNAAGYYTVSYDAALAGKLIKQGLPHLQPDESAATLRDIQLMFSSGVGDPEQELTFVNEFSHSSNPGLVRQVAGTVRGLSDFVPTELSRNYASLVRSLFDARARELGWKPRPNEAQEVRLLRIEIVPLVATYGGDSDLSSEAGSLAQAWLRDHQSLDPDMVEPVLSATAWNGDRKFFDQLVNEIRNDKIQRERSWMIDSLVYFRDPAITGDRLKLLFDKGTDPRELQYTLFNAPSQTREIVWEFVQKNFDAINSTIPGARGIPFGALLPLSAAGFCDATHQQQVESFFQPRMATLPGGARYLANSLERIRLCGARSAVVTPAIIELLKKQ
jgi:alanyl aminopeptidase